MPVEYRVFEDPTLVYIRYFDHVILGDIATALRQFAQEAERYAGQPHFFDFSKVTSFDIDYTEFFRLLGQLVEVYPETSGEHLCVFYAPDGVPTELAEVLRKPYEGSDTMLIRLVQTREHAFDVLGWQRADLVAHIETLT